MVWVLLGETLWALVDGDDYVAYLANTRSRDKPFSYRVGGYDNEWHRDIPTLEEAKAMAIVAYRMGG